MENFKIYHVSINTTAYVGDDKKVINETFDFSGRTPDCACSFAQGYAEALMWIKSLNHPLVMQLDGYHWWDNDGNDVIKVTNEQGIIVTQDDWK